MKPFDDEVKDLVANGFVVVGSSATSKCKSTILMRDSESVTVSQDERGNVKVVFSPEMTEDDMFTALSEELNSKLPIPGPGKVVLK